MSGSTLTAFNYIAEGSEATPGLWNSVFSILSQNITEANSIGTIVSNISAVGMVTINANSNSTDYLAFVDTTNQRSSYILGSHIGGTADGLGLYDTSGATMIVAFSKQSVRFYTSVVGSAFDIGGATFNVRGFGALGNGVADDTAALQAAIDAASLVGGEVQVPPGTYSVTSSGQYCLSIQSPVLMTGAPGSWIQLSTTTANTWILRVQASTYTAVNNVQIKGVGFDGNNVAPQCVGIRAIYTKSLLVEECQFKNFGATVFANPGYCIYSSGSTTPTPPSPFPWSTYSAAPLGWTADTKIIANSFSSCSGSDAIFLYYTDGATIYNNIASGSGKLCYVMGWDRNITVLGNVVEQVTDNGIRCGADESILSTDPRDMDSVSIIGNVVRSSNRDGIRFSANKSTVVGNISSKNTLSGIAGVVCVDSTIANNVCTDNLNHGIGLVRSTVTGWGTYRSTTVIGNQTHRNAGRGILVSGGGDSSASVAQAIKVIGNNASYNSLDGIAMWDCDDSCEVVNNTCWSNGSVGDSSGIIVTNQVMGTGTGGLLVSWNRCFDSRSTLTAYQIRGIGLSSVTAGSKVSGLRYYFNDVSGTTSNITSSARGYETLGNGTASPSLLIGNLARAPIANPYLLQSSDTIVYFDEVGSIRVLPGSAVFPTFAFSSETSLGWYRSAASVMALSYGTLTLPTLTVDNLQGNSTQTLSIISSILVRRAASGDGITARHTGGGNYEIRHMGTGQFLIQSDNGKLVLSAGTSSDDLIFETGDSTTIRQTIRSGGTTEFTSSVWFDSGISVGTGGTIIPAISSISSLIGAFVVQGSASSFTVVAWTAVKQGDQILTQPFGAGVSSLSSGLVAHSLCTQAGQIEFRLSNVSTLVQNQSSVSWYFTRITPF